MRAALPHLDRPWTACASPSTVTRLVVVDAETAFEPTGQQVFDFGLGELADKVAAARRRRRRRALPEAPARDGATATFTARSAYDWFVEGTRAEGGRDDADARAEPATARRSRWIRGWRPRAQPGRPRLPRGDTTRARDAFEAALALDPDQPEARFNLANLVLEAGDLELAVAEFRRVLQADPEFADAHFNLAVALERLGGRSQARAHLERYLALEPTTSSWADQARALIDRLA